MQMDSTDFQHWQDALERYLSEIRQNEGRYFHEKQMETDVHFLVLILSMIGCGQKETEPKEEQTQTEDTKDEESTQETQQKEESTQSAEPEQGSQSQKEIKIYFANKDASGFETEEVAMEDVSAEKIWEQLVAKGVVPADTQVISCTEKTIDGEKALQLDLSENFLLI